VEIIAEIIRQDPNAKQGLKLKLAIAIGMTFSTEVLSMAHGSAIDGIARYHNYAKWSDEKVLFSPFYTLNAWQMRYVVGSWAEDEELIWARNNALEEYKNPEKIGSVTHSMVEYKLYNDDGISVQDDGYYYGKPVTLEWIHTIGGVCGSISKFGSGMAQAFGIPALPVGQPGHCAFIWYKNGTQWYLDNDISGWGASTAHTGIQYTWKLQAPFFPMMNEAQSNPDAYRLSEKMRILAGSFSDSKYKFLILEDATTICPQNFDLWHDMRNAMSEEAVNKDILETVMSPTFLHYWNTRKKSERLRILLEEKLLL
jgi:chitin-binding protein